MRITVSKSIQADHDLIKNLVREGFAGVDSRHVEVHVKARTAKVYWLIMCYQEDECSWPINYRSSAKLDQPEPHGAAHYVARKPKGRIVHEHGEENVIRQVSDQGGFSGRAYSEIPSIANVVKGTLYLVTLTIPTNPEGRTCYPRTNQYYGLKTAPSIEIPCWQADLIHLAAHESKHVEQFREGLPHSEIRCEHYANHVMRQWLAKAEARC